MSEEEIIDCQLSAFHKYLSKRNYVKCSKQLLNDNGYFKPTEMAEKLGITSKKFYLVHEAVYIRLQFRCHFYYKKK